MVREEKSESYDTVPISVVDDATAAYPGESNNIEETLHKMNDAARRIAAFERGIQMHRLTPRASRLSPLRDISSEVQRQNTPSHGDQVPTGNERTQENEESNEFPDLWPWLAAGDVDEREHDAWISTNDPLKERQLPTSTTVPQHEEEDTPPASTGRIIPPSRPMPAFPGHGNRRLRMTFVGLVALALLILIIDSVLVSLALLRPHGQPSSIGGSPSITLSTSAVMYGQAVTLYIHHFTPSTQVYVTKDIAEPLATNSGKPLVGVGKDGSAQTVFYIESNWNPGFHTITAEDVQTHYTANVSLRVAAGPTRPSHLVLSTTEIDLGAAMRGANTVQSLTLHNAGSGTITWQASSNQPWLQITPNQGMFGSSQTIAIAGQRGDLKVGDYQGVITLTSNVSGPQTIQVTMSVQPLPPHAAALSIAPAVLSFSAQDGGNDPPAQPLTVSNLGSQPLYWSVANTTADPAQTGPSSASAGGTSWLNMDQTSGVVAPNASATIQVSVHAHNLLTGVYMSALVFSASKGHSAYNSPQNVMVSLSVQPHCSLVLNTGSLTFTAVAGRSNPANQALNISSTTGCPAATGWHATTSANWLTITPADGQLNGVTGSVITVGANTSGLAPKTYSATVQFSTASSTQTIDVQLTVQAPPPPGAPIISASPLNINFAATQGEGNLPPQTVTITNTGGGTLTWRSAVNFLVTPWLGISPTGGTIAAKQTGQVTINVNPSRLAPGTYVGQVTLSGTDGNQADVGGSPQVITVNLVVTPPCTLAAPSSSSLAFSAVQGGANPAPQAENLNASGNCNWPLNWHISVSHPAPWLSVSPTSGAFSMNKQSVTAIVAPNINGLAPGTYTAQVTVSAVDASNAQATGNPQTFAVTLQVQQPCTLTLAPGKLAFTSSAAHPAAPQTLQLSESGACATPVNWKAQSNASWLVVTSSGTDTGNGSSIAVSVATSGLTTGSYQGTVIITASASGSAGIQGSPANIPVTLTVG